LVDHIQTRGRDYEGSISIDYLKKLNERYENWISQYKLGRLLIISTDELDFVNKQEDLGSIIQSVRTQLHGLF
jgi:deoxyadenosine/deoxycytidine kinase